MFGSQLGRRYRQVCRVVRRDGARGLCDRFRRAAAMRLEPDRFAGEVFPEDVLGARAVPTRLPSAPVLDPGVAMTVNWVMSPPGPGSGGHTTIFRLIEHLERAGHTCMVSLYDVYGTSAHDHAATLRRLYPGFRGEIHDAVEGLPDAHAVFATSWQTAYPVARSPASGLRFYLVQDFEPYFYPHGTWSSLAEDTYRLGFHAVTAGRWLAGKLSAEYDMRADSFDFGCDTKYYRRDPGAVRDGVVFYARKDAPRRASELGNLALELFAREHPEITIHLFGGRAGHLPFPHVDHGRVPPAGLNEIYNRCYAGLSLSMTNVSLVPFEMMASGCLPVVNEALHNRVVLDNQYVIYAPPSPRALADALADACSRRDFTMQSEAAAASARVCSWADAGAVVERVLRRELSSGAQLAS